MKTFSQYNKWKKDTNYIYNTIPILKIFNFLYRKQIKKYEQVVWLWVIFTFIFIKIFAFF